MVQIPIEDKHDYYVPPELWPSSPVYIEHGFHGYNPAYAHYETWYTRDMKRAGRWFKEEPGHCIGVKPMNKVKRETIKD